MPKTKNGGWKLDDSGLAPYGKQKERKETGNKQGDKKKKGK